MFQRFVVPPVKDGPNSLESVVMGEMCRQKSVIQVGETMESQTQQVLLCSDHPNLVQEVQEAGGQGFVRCHGKSGW